MKKIFCVVLAVFMCLSFASCGKKEKKQKEIKVNKSQFAIVFDNRTGEKIKGITMTYSVMDEEVGSTYIINKDKDFIFNEDRVYKIFEKEEFKGYPSLSTFEFKINVVNAKDENVIGINTIELVAHYGNVYEFVLDGNSNTGVHLSKIVSTEE